MKAVLVYLLSFLLAASAANWKGYGGGYNGGGGFGGGGFGGGGGGFNGGMKKIAGLFLHSRLKSNVSDFCLLNINRYKHRILKTLYSLACMFTRVVVRTLTYQLT
jgi:hypothetical protein